MESLKTIIDKLGDLLGGTLVSEQYLNDEAQTTAAAGAIIFLPTQKNEPKKEYPNTAKTPQSPLFFGLAHNSLCSNNALTDPKNNRLYGRGIRGVKPARITAKYQPNIGKKPREQSKQTTRHEHY